MLILFFCCFLPLHPLNNQAPISAELKLTGEVFTPWASKQRLSASYLIAKFTTLFSSNVCKDIFEYCKRNLMWRCGHLLILELPPSKRC